MTGWTENGLLRSWRALAHPQDGADWQFVHLTDVGPVSVEAGCHFPGVGEALIDNFPRMAAATERVSDACALSIFMRCQEP